LLQINGPIRLTNTVIRDQSGIFHNAVEPFRQTSVDMSRQKLSGAQGSLNARYRTGHVLMAVILIVEDEKFIQQNAAWVMEDLGHDSLLACDFGEALVHLSALGVINALFVDIRLNQLALGGYDVANKAVALRPRLPVLYTSGTPLTSEMTDRFVNGGRFLQKPYSPEQLEASIHKILH